MGYSLVHVEGIQPAGPGGAVRSVRRELGVEAFGINRVYRVDGEEVPVRAGTALRFDPETTRVPIAGPDGMTMIVVGARRGTYEPRGPF